MPALSKPKEKCIKCVGPAKVTVRADGEFHIYRSDSDGKKGERIGPFFSTARYFVFVLAADELCYWIVAAGSVEYGLSVEVIHRKEDPDPTPVELPAGYNHPLPLRDEMRRFIRDELSNVAASAGDETFEECDDFDCHEDEEVLSPYELSEMQEEYVADDEPEEVPEKKGDEVTEVVAEKVEEGGEPLAKAAKPED